MDDIFEEEQLEGRLEDERETTDRQEHKVLEKIEEEGDDGRDLKGGRDTGGRMGGPDQVPVLST